MNLDSDYWSHAFEGWEDRVCEVEYSSDGVTLPKAIAYHDDGDERKTLEQGVDFEFSRVEYSGHRAVADRSKIQGPGLYTVYYRAIGDAHTGSFSLQLQVKGDSGDLAQGSIEARGWYDLVELQAQVTCEVYDSSDEPVPSDEYDLVFYDADGNALADAPGSSGTYKVKAKAKNDSTYTGETPMAEFDIVGESHIGGDRFYGDLSPAVITYTGKPIRWPTPSISYYDDDWNQVGLKYGTDYVLDRYEDAQGNAIQTGDPPSEPGTYYARYKGAGYYTGYRKMEFEIADPHDIGSSYWDYRGFKDEKDLYAYTGKPVVLAEAEILRRDDGAGDVIRLQQGRDFEFKGYRDAMDDEVVEQPAEIGECHAVYQGKGSYTGETSIRFRIESAADLSDAKFELGRTVVSSLSELSPVVTDLAGRKLTLDVDYELVYYDAWSFDEEVAEPYEPGYYSVIARAKDGNAAGYEGETHRCEFELREPVAGIVNMLSNRSYTATYTYQKDWIGKFVALEGALYEFYVSGNALSELYADPWQDVMLWNVSHPRTEGGFCTVCYLNAGEAAYLFVNRGYGDWYGTTGKSTVRVRKISNKDLQYGSVDVDDTGFKYTGKAIKPRVHVYDSLDNYLREGVDYAVSYKNNVNAGTATLTVTGRGKYAGSKSVTFRIAKAASKVSVAAQTKTYNGKAQAYFSKVTRSGSGGKVTYRYYSDAACKKEVKAANVKAAGTYYVRATLAADANFNGATSSAARLTIARAKVAVPKATNRAYNGKQQVGVPTGAGYALKGTARATKAGTYTATATPDANHCWTDGKANARKLTWKITAPSVR